MKEVNANIKFDKDVKYNYSSGGWDYYYNVKTGEQYVETIEGKMYLREIKK